jgi:NAD(P)-dependent dehydrogenase (short-subunit alcohol dehydrogenase family)
LDGKHALVTGASRGIGLAIATALAAEGARLTLVGRSPTRLQAASAACRQAGAPLTEISPRDLTRRGALSGLVSGPAATVDILVNNAGAAPTAPLERTDDVLWDDTFALNVYVPFALCRAGVISGLFFAGSSRGHGPAGSVRSGGSGAHGHTPAPFSGVALPT